MEKLQGLLPVLLASVLGGKCSKAKYEATLKVLLLSHTSYHQQLIFHPLCFMIANPHPLLV
jgi:hypothetical protein